MNNLNEEESQFSSYMDLSNEFDNNEVAINVNNIDRPPRNYGKVNNLRSIQELPKKFQHIFSFPFFNIIQSTVMDDVLYSDKGIVVSAPTSSGKTVVFELAIIRLLMAIEDTNYSGSYKIVYVAPVKALCNERLSEWHSKFSKIGISCIVVTGDSDIINMSLLDNYHIIITTPEKWDSLTRKVKDNNIFKDVKLFMIDEVHLLNEETRGPILEAIVCRLKILKQFEPIRFVAVSSTIPNIEDIAEWLKTNNNPAVHFKIDEKFRPVKLNKIVLGYPCRSGEGSFKFDLSLNYKLQEIIMKYAEGKPTLIFCSTRKGVEMTATHISKAITFHLAPEQKRKLEESASKMVDNKMKIQLSNGVGCHHGGMTPENRFTIENLFRGGFLPVLITTSTLAMGVNLPAHLVIIKSTEFYTQGGFQDYSESSLMQMIGRAGRPQFDTSATVVIMTKSWQKTKYERMLGGTELIESNLHRHLTEHLNAEVVLGIISDIAVALDWLRETFLYIRVQKNPKHYNIPTNYSKNEIEKKLQDLCQIEINALNRHGMLQIDQTDGFSLYPTNMGKIMANYYLAFNTMKLFVEIKGTESLVDILNIITKASEFSETYLRVNDKKTLNTLNRCKYQDTIRFPLPGKIKTSAMKVNCIIQATFGCLRIQDPSLLQESQKIMKIGERVSNCLVEYLIQKDNCFNALLNALILNQCFHAKIWENSAHVSRQCHKIGTVLSSMLVAAGKTTFKSILESSPRDIEMIINRSAPMGNQIQEEVLHLPFYRIKVDPPEKNDIFKVKIIVTLLNPENILPICTAGLNSCMTLLVGDSENHILCYKKLYHNSMAVCKEHAQYVNVVSNNDHVIRAYLVSENWVGIDCQDNVDIIIKNISNVTVNINNNNNSLMQTPKQTTTIKKTINTPITQYFKSSKNLPIKDIEKQTRPKKPNISNTTKKGTKPIETYFSKEQSNTPQKQNTCINYNKQKNNTNEDKNLPNDEQDSIILLENENSYSSTQNTNKFRFNNKMTKNEVVSKNKNETNKLNTFDKFEQCLKKIRESSSNSLASTSTQNNKDSNNDVEELNLNETIFKNFELNEDNNNIMETNNENNLVSMNDTINFENFSFFEQCSQKNNSTNYYNTEFHSSNLNDIFMSQSQNYSQFSLCNNNNCKTEEKKKLQPKSSIFKVPENKLHNKTLENINKSSISQYSIFSQNNTPTNILTKNKTQISNTQNIAKPPTKLLSHVTNKNFLNTYRKSVENKSGKALEILSQFHYKPKKKFQHRQHKTQSDVNIFEPEVILEIQDNFDNYNNEISNYKVVEIISKNTCTEKVNNIPKNIIAKQVNTDKNQNISSKTNLNSCKNLGLKTLNNNNNNNNEEKVIATITQQTRSALKQEEKIDKPAFPGSFMEYVQETIKKLKAETLVNEYYNYDIGIEEFLMAPFNENLEDSDDENSQDKTNNENINQKQIIDEKTNEIETNAFTSISPNFTQFIPKDSQINLNLSTNEKQLIDEEFTLKSPNFTQLIPQESQMDYTSNNDKSYDFDNITFVSQISGSYNENCSIHIEDENKFFEEHMDMDMNMNMDMSSFSFLSQNSDVGNTDLRSENKLKIIEQWIDSQVTQTKQINIEQPKKKLRLSSPLVYSKNYTSENEQNKKISNKIIQNNIFGVDNKNKPIVNKPENTEETNDSTILQRSSYSRYCVEDETNYEVVIYKKHESFITKKEYLEKKCNSSETNFGKNWSPEVEKKKNDEKKPFSFTNNVFF